MATGAATKPKRGTPEHKEYMRNLGRKGGYSTRDKHPNHLKEIAAIGGRATRTKHLREPELSAPIDEPVTAAPEIIGDIDAFFASLDNG